MSICVSVSVCMSVYVSVYKSVYMSMCVWLNACKCLCDLREGNLGPDFPELSLISLCKGKNRGRGSLSAWNCTLYLKCEYKSLVIFL